MPDRTRRRRLQRRRPPSPRPDAVPRPRSGRDIQPRPCARADMRQCRSRVDAISCAAASCKMRRGTERFAPRRQVAPFSLVPVLPTCPQRMRAQMQVRGRQPGAHAAAAAGIIRTLPLPASPGCGRRMRGGMLDSGAARRRGARAAMAAAAGRPSGIAQDSGIGAARRGCGDGAVGRGRGAASRPAAAATRAALSLGSLHRP